MKMRILFLFIFIILFISCNKAQTCRPYSEAIADGSAENKTSFITLNDSMRLELDYVRDQEYRNYPFFCYGHIKIPENKFKYGLKSFISKYNVQDVICIELFGENKNICFNEEIDISDIYSYMVYYLDEDNNVMLDYIDLISDKAETFKVSNKYASVIIYSSFKDKRNKKYPSVIEVYNSDFDKNREMKYSKQENDNLYKLANP